MSIPRGFGINGKSYYTNIAKPIDVNLNFIVDSTNGNGLGIRSLKSNGFVESVFMNTSATPGYVNGVKNPNPQAGYAQVRFKNNFNAYLGGYTGVIAPATSTGTTTLVAGNVYVITSLGTSTTANWVTAGFPIGFTPAVGAVFVAAISGSITGSGTVGIPGASQIDSMSVAGDSNLLLNQSNVAQYAGASIMVQFLSSTSSSNTTLIPTAPSNNSVVSMMFRFDGSSVTVDGL